MTNLLVAALVTAACPAHDAPFDRFIGSWRVVESTFGSVEASVTMTPAAEGCGIHSVWRQGQGESLYEAHALWGYDADTGEVKVFEVNTQGAAMLHVGGFDESGALVVRSRSEGGELDQQRVFEWEDEDTLVMRAEFYSENGVTHHSVRLVRR